jgi:quercetin dioxygenase-like cupin family protein
MTAVGARTYLKTHKLSGKKLRFKMDDEQLALLARAADSSTGRTAKTLVKEGPLRLTLVALRRGARMARHHVDGQASIHVLRGRLTIQADGGESTLSSGDLIVLNRGVEHAVEAKSDCAFLITMSWHRDV